MSTSRTDESIVDKFVSKLTATFHKTLKEFYSNADLKSVFTNYINDVKHLATELYSSGYSLIGLNIDYPLYQMLSSKQPISLLDTFYRLKNTSGKLVKSCLQQAPQANYLKTTQCGVVHVDNLHSLPSSPAEPIRYHIHTPILFYIWMDFLEILLVGGLRDSEYHTYQAIQVVAITKIPMSHRVLSSEVLFNFYGSHPPFTTIIASELAVILCYFGVYNKYSSLKITYSAVDIQVCVYNHSVRNVGIFLLLSS